MSEAAKLPETTESFWVEKKKGGLEDTLRPAHTAQGLEGFEAFAQANDLQDLVADAKTLAEKYPAGTGDDKQDGDGPKLVLEPYRYPTY